MKMRRGVTLVEVSLAGAIAVLATLSLMEGLIVGTTISHENAQLLAAEGYAMDVAWIWLNKSYEDLNGSTEPRWYPDKNGYVISSNACPMICKAMTGADARCYVKVTMQAGNTAVKRHDVAETESKLIEVDVEWGPPSRRLRLNSLAPASAKSFHTPISVSKCAIERGEVP